MAMSGILENFKKQLEEDRKEENYDIEISSDDLKMNKEEFEQYKVEVDKLREEMYKGMDEYKRIENKSYPNTLIEEKKEDNSAGVKKESETKTSQGKNMFNKNTLNLDFEEFAQAEGSNKTKKFVIIHARCPFCGEEINSEVPTMYNPFSHKAQTPYECHHCGNQYMTDFAYPRLGILDENNLLLNIHMS